MKKHEEYLDSVALVVDRFGVRGVSMVQIARALGISKATLYNNFGTQTQLLEALVEYQNGLLRERVVSISSRHNLDPLMILVRVLDYVALSYYKRSSLFITTLHENYPVIYDYMNRLNSRLLEEFFALNIPRGRSQDLYRGDFKTDIIASLCFSILRTVDDSWSDPSGMSFEQYRREVVLFVLRSIIAPSLQGRLVDLGSE
ncbi:MAG: TetR/AcrR family transcriptional regulator [Rikenellaceae bacterium]